MKPAAPSPSYSDCLSADEHRVAAITAAIDTKRRYLAPQPMRYRPAPVGPDNLSYEHWACLWDTAWDAMWRIATFPENEQKARRWPSIQAAVRAAAAAGRLPFTPGNPNQVKAPPST